jgi:small GTP-binding protein
LDIQEKISRIPFSNNEDGIVKQLLAQSESTKATVGVFGSFSVGKSELINQLLGKKELLPTHTNESTAVVTRITYGEEDSGELFYRNGQVKPISLPGLQDYAVGGTVEEIAGIKVTLSEPDWLEQIEFIDTPGRNTKYQAHVEASTQAIIEADAAIYVLPWQGITLEDIAYLQELIPYQPNLYFVLNKVDRIEEEQGQTIEDVRKQVEKELREQLGAEFPVYALSAKTGYQLDRFREEFIPELAENIQAIKQNRFTHALTQFLLKHEQILLNEINLYKMAVSSDKGALDDEIRTLEMEQSKFQERINKDLSVIKAALSSAKTQVEDSIELTLRQAKEKLAAALKEIGESHQRADSVKGLVENQLKTIRNTIYKNFEEKINAVTSDAKAYRLSELEEATVNIQYQEPTFADLQTMYEDRLKQISRDYQLKKDKLDLLLSSETAATAEDEVESIQQSLSELEEQLLEEYVPQYVQDVNYDPNKATKILGYIGKAGDLALSVALAVATSGVSAGAQIAGKAGAEVAKEAGKQTAKAVAKEAVNEAGKTVAKEVVKSAGEEAAKAVVKETGKAVMKEAGEQVVKEVAEEVAKQAGKEVFKKVGLESLKVLGQIASPVESFASSIGQAIDQSRKPEEFLDQKHRQQFYLKRLTVEDKYDALKNELKQLREAQKASDVAVLGVEKKMAELEVRQKEEISQLERDMKREEDHYRAKHFETTMNKQLEELLLQERTTYTNWVELEINRVYLMLSKTIPGYYQQEFEKWKTKIQTIKDTFAEKESGIEGQLQTLQQQITLCQEIREQLAHVE